MTEIKKYYLGILICLIPIIGNVQVSCYIIGGSSHSIEAKYN